MAETKTRSLRMTDAEYATIRNYSKSRGLPIAKSLVELINDKPSDLNPEVMCRLITLGKIVRIPAECWNEEIVKIYEECVKKLCVSLKW